MGTDVDAIFGIGGSCQTPNTADAGKASDSKKLSECIQVKGSAALAQSVGQIGDCVLQAYAEQCARLNVSLAPPQSFGQPAAQAPAAQQANEQQAAPAGGKGPPAGNATKASGGATKRQLAEKFEAHGYALDERDITQPMTKKYDELVKDGMSAADAIKEVARQFGLKKEKVEEKKEDKKEDVKVAATTPAPTSAPAAPLDSRTPVQKAVSDLLPQ